MKYVWRIAKNIVVLSILLLTLGAVYETSDKIIVSILGLIYFNMATYFSVNELQQTKRMQFIAENFTRIRSILLKNEQEKIHEVKVAITKAGFDTLDYPDTELNDEKQLKKSKEDLERTERLWYVDLVFMSIFWIILLLNLLSAI